MALSSALARSCHPAPTVAVTVFATVLAATAGNSVRTCVLLAVAVLAGQLSIGWSNDRLDAGRDRAVGRRDKPVAAGELATPRLDLAIAAALAVTITFSLTLGWRAGLVHLGAVGCGWLYNVWAKATVLSWLPYAAAFAALPAVATLALPAHPGPAGWVLGAGALLGVTGHLTNALPDLAGDLGTGITGLPQRLGAGRSLRFAAALLVAATALIVFGPPGAVEPLGWAALAAGVAAAAIAARLAEGGPTGRAAFYGILLTVAIDLAVIAVSGHQLR